MPYRFSRGPRLSAIDRSLLAEYQLLGWAEVPCLLAIDPRRPAEVVELLVAGGARIVTRQDDIGYVYAQIPADRLPGILTLAGVDALQVTAGTVRGASASEPVSSVEQKTTKAPAPNCYLRPDNPYTAEYATQALALKSLPGGTYDGRGVVIAFVEPAAPNMATMRGALSLTGQRRPKFAFYDLGPADDPADWDATPPVMWQQTKAIAPDTEGRFTLLDKTYHLPPGQASQEWRACLRRPFRGLGPSVSYLVLWAVELNRLWVLPDSVGTDFAQAKQGDFHESWAWVQVGHPGVWRESGGNPRCVVFNVREEPRLLGFTLAWSEHGGMVASVMAGQGFLGSQADGVAPAAQLAVIQRVWHETQANRNIFEEMIAGLRDGRVDILEASVCMGDTARFNAGNVYRILADRLLGRNGRIFVKSAGNHGPVLDKLKEIEASSEVFAVGAYVPKETWQANFGLTPSAELSCSAYSGYGPAADGGLKPDFLGLTHTLCEGLAPSVYYDLPAEFKDFGVSGITSSSAPHGAANIALLVSAAKQHGLACDRTRMRAAIATTARFLTGVEARVQGHGLIQSLDAWAALQRAQAWTPTHFDTSAPVIRAEAGPAETGRGLFEMSGWSPHAAQRREVTVTRIDGPREPQRFQLRWKGCIENFSSAADHVILPLGTPVAIAVDIRVAGAGDYSAILDLVEPESQLVVHSVMCTVMVAVALNAANGYRATFQGECHRPGNALMYVDVPAGLSVLSLQLKKDRAKCFWWAQDPTGRVLPYRLYGAEVTAPGTPWTKQEEFCESYPDPTPGVWQFWIQSREPFSREDLLVEEWPQTMPYTAEVTGIKVTPEAGAGHEGPGPISFRNRSADFEAQLRPLGLGAARDARAELKPGLGQVSFQVEVPEGASRLEVACGHDSPGSRVGFYLFKIPTDERRERTLKSDKTALIYHDPSGVSRKKHVIVAPPPGRYQATLDLPEGPAEGVAVEYRDIVFHPYLGELSCADPLAWLKAGECRNGTANVTVRALPEGGRHLVAQVGLFCPTVGYLRRIEEAPAPAARPAGEKFERVPVPVATHTWSMRQPRPH